MNFKLVNKDKFIFKQHNTSISCTFFIHLYFISVVFFWKFRKRFSYLKQKRSKKKIKWNTAWNTKKKKILKTLPLKIKNDGIKKSHFEGNCKKSFTCIFLSQVCGFVSKSVLVILFCGNIKCRVFWVMNFQFLSSNPSV